MACCLRNTKYHNRKIVIDGIVYDSVKEYKRHTELLLLEKAGAIRNLQRQVKFELIPAQKIKGKTVERACSYVADYVYQENGETVVEDVKGYRTPEYSIKKKLMLYLHNIRIKEV